MCQNSKQLNVTSPLKNNFIFATLSIHTIQNIKYHYHTFSLFNSKFKFQNFSNPSFPPTFSLIPTNITLNFQLTFLYHSFQISFLFFLTINILFLISSHSFYFVSLFLLFLTLRSLSSIKKSETDFFLSSL
jgi:hypothetical protein